MSQPTQAVQKTNGSFGMPLFKLALSLAALIALGFSVVMIDLPNRNYLWLAAELVVAVLLILAVIGSFKRILAR